MESFYIIVLVVALVFLLMILTVMGVMMKSQNKSTVYPPTMNTCPDYWTEDASGNCTRPTDATARNQGDYYVAATPAVAAVAAIGSNPAKPAVAATPASLTPFLIGTAGPPYALTTSKFDPADKSWTLTGKTAICAKRDWAVKHNIVWDGVSNYNNCKV